jgi:hypothetical protein
MIRVGNRWRTLFLIVLVWVLHLKDTCGDMPYKYGVRCTFAITGPKKAFAHLVSTKRSYTITQSSTDVVDAASQRVNDANLDSRWHLDLPLLVWQTKETPDKN